MDESIKQLGQDLALTKYAKSTCRKYLKTAEHLANRFGRPLAELTREQLRTYVEEISGLGNHPPTPSYRLRITLKSTE